MMRRAIPAAAAASLLAAAAPSPAAGDTLVTAASGARNLAFGAGWLAWTARDSRGGWRLVTRSPSGVQETAPFTPSRRALQPEIGWDRSSAGRRLVVVYSREDGRGDADVYAYDLRSKAERAIPGASRRGYDETSPSLHSGRLVFSRSGGRGSGVVFKNGRRLRRIWPETATETATNGARAALAVGGQIILVHTTGSRAYVRIKARRAHSLGMTRHNVVWLMNGRAWSTGRIRGDAAPTVSHSQRPPSLALRSLAVGASLRAMRLLDHEGIKVPDPGFF